ncbi:MAG: carbohydrate ABC transporter permease [Oscillospiraceae bacterium]|jgi:multiple sugar transport system permease protein|nr:carbohydrate ABC transporter permease [Oscillospiraceae bacterium]
MHDVQEVKEMQEEIQENFKGRIKAKYNDKHFVNERHRALKQGKDLLIAFFRTALILGLSYVILGPLIGIVANSFFSNADAYSPIVYLIPQSPTLERYELAIIRMSYWDVMLRMMFYVVGLTIVQLLVCSMVGYGFARHNFPGKKILFACVIIMIVIPSHTVMLPLYTTFMDFNPLGIVGLLNNGESINLLGGPNSFLGGTAPMIIMTLLGTGLRAGLYIYIFNQFFRGLPKEIEEAAAIDGAGAIYTYMRIMMPNAMPSIITVTIFSIVWQYNDTFFSNLFMISNDIAISKQITSLQANISNLDQVFDPAISTLYLYAGIVLVIIPVVALYVLLQKQFIEGVERSGIVG